MEGWKEQTWTGDLALAMFALRAMNSLFLLFWLVLGMELGVVKYLSACVSIFSIVLYFLIQILCLFLDIFLNILFKTDILISSLIYK